MNKVDTQVMEIEESVIQLQNLGSLNISEIIKSAQSQNGLKHSDYDRYRRYCSQKVKRIRKILRFSHGKKYASKDVVKEKPNDPRLLQVLLFQSEKNWAYAMYFKSQNQGDLKKKKPNRSKFRLRAKLRRALQWSKKLQDICENRTEKRTALESEAYAAFLEGLFDFEMERWEQAQDVYVKCRSIYTEIMKVSDSLQGVLYKEKIEQIDQALRYCNHKASKGKSMMTIENILEMKQQIKDPALNQKLEELLEQNRQNQIEQKQG